MGGMSRITPQQGRVSETVGLDGVWLAVSPIFVIASKRSILGCFAYVGLQARLQKTAVTICTSSKLTQTCVLV